MVGRLTFGDAQVGGPGDVSVVPAAVDVVESGRVLEVGSVDGKLVEGIQLALQRVVGIPRIGPGAFEHVHAVIDGRAGVVAKHVRLWGRGFIVCIGGEDDVPSRVDVVQFRSPEAV